jgi:glutaminyl-tRNA synthetase
VHPPQSIDAVRPRQLVGVFLQGVLSWVGQPAVGQEPPSFEARLYDVLFKTASVAETGDDWLSDLNPDSLTVVSGALATQRLAAAPPGSRYLPSLLGVVCLLATACLLVGMRVL